MFVLHHWRDNIYCLEGLMRDWFDAQGFTRIQDFAILTDDDIDEMEYVDVSGVASKAPKRHRTCIKACIAYYQYVDYYDDEYCTCWKINDTINNLSITETERMQSWNRQE
jgi:hypothetical protein